MTLFFFYRVCLIVVVNEKLIVSNLRKLWFFCSWLLESDEAPQSNSQTREFSGYSGASNKGPSKKRTASQKGHSSGPLSIAIVHF